MASRDWNWWYADCPGKLWSVSQAATFMACNRRWGFKHLDKIKEPQRTAAAAGDAGHAEMEAWAKLGKMPTLPYALGALRHAPPPGIAEVEVPLRVTVDGVHWLGFADLVYGWDFEQQRPIPIYPGEPLVVHDWKFVSLQWILTPEKLKADPAACLYALAAYEAGASHVTCRWVYTPRKAHPARPEIVQTHISHEEALSIVREISAAVAHGEAISTAHRKKQLKVLDLDYDTGHCFDYRVECHYKTTGDCKHDRLPFQLGGDTMQAFMNHAASLPGIPTIPGIPNIPPPPPVAVPSLPPPVAAPSLPPPVAAPSLPPPVAAPSLPPLPGLPPVEAGFVNPARYAPAVPASSPEHAVALQGDITAGEKAAAVVSDDLDAYNVDQLKALAGQLGLIKPNSRPREATLRALIRAHRITEAAKGAVVEIHSSPAINVSLPPMSPQQEAEMAAFAASITPQEIFAPTVPSPGAQPATEGFRLFVNCRPATHPRAVTLETHDLLRLANARLHRDHAEHPRDYRLIRFEGVGQFALATQDELDEQKFSGDIVLDTRTPEGGALLNTLRDLASEVVVGL